MGGFIPEGDREAATRDKKLQSAKRLVPPHPKEAPPVTLLKSGIDSVFWLQTKQEECLRRAFGRRFDHLQNNEYHIDDNPPATTSAPLCERLAEVDDESVP